jgi:F-type H+-transporting ATPase subunit b
MSVSSVWTGLLAASGGGLTDVNLGLTIWTVVLFALFAFVLTRFGWRPLLGVIEERERTIRDAVSGAHKANDEAQALLAKHREMLRDAAREREEILGRTLKEAEQVKADLTARARGESDQLIARAKDQIEREKLAAIGQLRAEVADLAIDAASRIVQSSLTPEAQRRLVDEFVSELPKQRQARGGPAAGPDRTEPSN